MDEALNDLHELSTSVFTNIGGITPSIKNLIASAKSFHKSYQGTIFLGTQFIQSLDAFAQSALGAKGATKSIGETLKDIIQIFCEIEALKGDLMKLFSNEVISSLESRAEQEVNMSKLAHKQYLQDNKLQTEVVTKQTQDLIKLRKKSQKRKGKAGKYEKREEELTDELQSSEKKLRELRENGLRRALIGERRIYCFVAERICKFGRGMAAHSKRIESMLTEKMAVWDKVVSQPDNLPTESEKVIMSPSSYTTATMKVKNSKTHAAALGRYHTIDARVTSSRPSVIGKESIEENPVESKPLTNGNIDIKDGKDVKDIKETEENKDLEEIKVDEKKVNGAVATAIPIPPKIEGMANGSMVRESSVKSLPPESSKITNALPVTVVKGELRALYNHFARDNSQLSFSKGDLLESLNEPTGGWQYGANMKTGKSGWFPASFVETIGKSPVPSPKIPVIHGSLTEKASPKTGKIRRFSTPASGHSPYIPAPDYDYDSKMETPKGTPERPRKLDSGSHTLVQHSLSSPGLIDTQEVSVTFSEDGPTIIPPPDFNDNTVVAPEIPPPTDFVTMPFPPPPPDVDFTSPEESDDSNPFAGIKLKKTVTNDRSMPVIPPSS